MAWNEPGGGNKDPWGGGNNQGPPDLDEALKKFQQKLNSLFGGGKSGSGSGGGGLSASVVVVLIAVVVVIWGLFGFYQVDEKERAVVLRFGKYLATYQPGLHWNPPLIDSRQIVRVTEERQYSSQGLMLTQDENIVELPLTVQYNVSDPKAFALNVKNPEISLQHATDSALRHVVGSSQLDEVVSSGRQKIGAEVTVRLQKYLDSYGAGIHVIKVNIQEAKPPAQVKSAYDDVVKAREDRERLINEAQAYANGVLPEARGSAQRVLEEAAGYRDKVIVEAQGEATRFEKLLAEYQRAPEVTRERLYLSTVQQVMSDSSKVLVDVEGGNNMLYIPIDKLMDAQGQGRKGASLSAQALNDIADEVINKLRSQKTSSTNNSRGEVR